MTSSPRAAPRPAPIARACALRPRGLADRQAVADHAQEARLVVDDAARVHALIANFTHRSAKPWASRSSTRDWQVMTRPRREPAAPPRASAWRSINPAEAWMPRRPCARLAFLFARARAVVAVERQLRAPQRRQQAPWSRDAMEYLRLRARRWCGARSLVPPIHTHQQKDFEHSRAPLDTAVRRLQRARARVLQRAVAFRHQYWRSARASRVRCRAPAAGQALDRKSSHSW